MVDSIPGIHHVTAITGEPQLNIDFYTGILGLRFVKKTVNFDVPDTYHLYYGDDLGRPGTILTFFSWPGYPRGRRGAGQVTTISFSIPVTALDYWRQRLQQKGIHVDGPFWRFEEQVLSFNDHEGLGLELVAHPDAEQGTSWTTGPIPSQHAIRGFHNVTLSITKFAHTSALLTEQLGFRHIGNADNRSRYQAGANSVDLLDVPGESHGIESIGTVHHVAFRTANDESQLEWRKELVKQGLGVTPVMNRIYFHSIYFREPSGVLFEIATDSPGFTVDEAPEELGTHLKLPPWLENRRLTLEENLPPIHGPEA